MTRRLSRDDMNTILEVVRAHMFKPKQTLARDTRTGEAITVNAIMGEKPDLTMFSQQEIMKLRDEDGWDVATNEQVYRIISETIRMMSSVGGQGAAAPPKLYPALASPATMPSVVAERNNPFVGRIVIGDVGALQGPENAEWLAFFYPAHTVFERLRLTAVVLNFSSPMTGEYVLQMMNALNPAKSSRDIHKFNGSKSSVMVIGLSEMFTQQTSITFRLQPAPLDAKGNRPLVRMELHFEYM